MDASLLPYTSGCIALYTSPLDRKESQRYHILPSHPVLILDVNFGFAPLNYNCMILTTKIDEYFGYKIFINTLDPKYRRMSLICPDHIYSIHKADLGEILGFAPPSLVEKCKKAFLYQIGMSDEVPEYYKSNDICMQYLTCGEPNAPVDPHGQRTHDGQTVETLNVVAYDTPITPTPDGLRKQKPYHVSVDDYLHDLPESCTPSVPTTSSVNEVIAPDPVPEVNDTASEKIEDHAEEEVVEQEPSKSAGTLSKLQKKDIEGRVSSKLSVSNTVVDLYNKIGPDMMYKIWMDRATPAQIMKQYGASSRYYGSKTIEYAQNRLLKRKMDLIEGVKEGSINLRFLGDAFILPFRILTQEDAKSIRLGITTYQAYCKYYNIDFEDTYIGELIKNNLLC